MGNTYKYLQTVTLASDQVSVEFNNIEQSYTDLIIRFSAGATTSGRQTSYTMTFNGSTSGYSITYNTGNGNDGWSGSRLTSQSSFSVPYSLNGATSGPYGINEIRIPKYSSSAYKNISFMFRPESDITQPFYTTNGAGLWQNTSGITSIALTPTVSGSFATGSTFALYAIKSGNL